MNKCRYTVTISCLLLVIMLGGCAPPAPPEGSITLEPITVTPMPSGSTSQVQVGQSGATEFSQQDLTIQGLTLGRSTLQEVLACYGPPLTQEEYLVQATGNMELCYEYDGLSFWGSGTDASANQEDPAAFTLVRINIQTPDFIGPRGVAVGNTMQQVIDQFEDRKYPDVGTQQVLYANHPLQMNAAWPDAFVDMPMLLPPYGVVQVLEGKNPQIGYLFVMDPADAPTTLDDDTWLYDECALMLMEIDADAKVESIAISLGPLAE